MSKDDTGMNRKEHICSWQEDIYLVCHRTLLFLLLILSRLAKAAKGRTARRRITTKPKGTWCSS